MREFVPHTTAYERLLALRPSDSLLWYVRAGHHLGRGDSTSALADFERGGEPPASNEFAYIYAAASLVAGDESGYARYVARQAALHGDSSDPFTPYVLARMSVLASVSPVPPQRVLEWATRAAASRPASLALAHAGTCRISRGEMEAARGAFEQSSQLAWGDSGALNELGLSLIALREGRIEDVRDRFDRARLQLDRPGKTLLPDWLEFKLLRPQIEGPLYDRPFPANPFAR